MPPKLIKNPETGQSSVFPPQRTVAVTYLEKYAPANDVGGPFAGYIGDPKAFRGIKFDKTNRGKWFAAPDLFGVHWLVLAAASNGAALYNWNAISTPQNGAPKGASAGAYEVFDAVRAEIEADAGLSSSGANDRFLYDWKYAAVDKNSFGWGVGDKSHFKYLNGDLPSLDDKYGRFAQVIIPLAGNGVPAGLSLVCTADLWTRAAVIDGVTINLDPYFYRTLPVSVTQAVTFFLNTVIDAFKIIVGVLTLNVGLIEGAVADLISTWYTFLSAVTGNGPAPAPIPSVSFKAVEADLAAGGNANKTVPVSPPPGNTSPLAQIALAVVAGLAVAYLTQE